MNKMKGKILTVLAVMFGFMLFVSPNVNAADLIEIDKAEVDILDILPCVDELLYKDLAKLNDDSKNYEIIAQKWIEGGIEITDTTRRVTLKDVEDQWEHGYFVAAFVCELYIKPKDGYKFSDDFKFEFSGNERAIDKAEITFLFDKPIDSSEYPGAKYVRFYIKAFKNGLKPVPNNIVIDGSEITSILESGEAKGSDVLKSTIAANPIEGVEYISGAFENINFSFQKGKEYKFILYFKEAEGYYYDGDINITINGVNWNSTITEQQTIYQRFEGKLTYDIDKYVQIDAEDLVLSVGEKVPMLSINSDEYQIVSQKWFDEKGNNVTNIDKLGTYTYELILKPTKYRFNAITRVELDTDWKTEGYEYISSGANAGCVKFTGTKDTYHIIREIELDLTKIKPVLGEVAGKYTGISDEYEIVMQDWFDFNEPNQPINKFDKKTMYVYSIGIVLKDGYMFAKDAKIKTKGLEWDAILFEYVDNYMGIAQFAGAVNLGNKLNISKGQDQIYTIGKSDTLSFTIDGDVSKLKEVVIMGIPLSSGEYEVKGDSNSTTITINKDIFDNALEGKYSFIASFGDLGVATTNLIVDDPTTDYVPGKVDNNTDKTDGAEGIKKNPATSDNIILAVGTLAVATVGVVTTTTILRKKDETNKNS